MNSDDFAAYNRLMRFVDPCRFYDFNHNALDSEDYSDMIDDLQDYDRMVRG